MYYNVNVSYIIIHAKEKIKVFLKILLIKFCGIGQKMRVLF